MRVIARPSAGHSPHSTMSAAADDERADRVGEAEAVARGREQHGRPGVDHAKASGIRSQSAATMLTMATARHSANSPDAASRAVAPTATRPAMTSTNERANPEMAATKPAEMGWSIPPA